MDFDVLLRRANAYLKCTYTSLKEKQKETLEAAAVSDTLCVLPTGYGKGVVIQLLPFLGQDQVEVPGREGVRQGEEQKEPEPAAASGEGHPPLPLEQNPSTIEPAAGDINPGVDKNDAGLLVTGDAGLLVTGAAGLPVMEDAGLSAVDDAGLLVTGDAGLSGLGDSGFSVMGDEGLSVMDDADFAVMVTPSLTPPSSTTSKLDFGVNYRNISTLSGWDITHV